MNESFCECFNWARAGLSVLPMIKSKDGLPLMTTHHERCPHYNDSLIDVWKVEVGGVSSYNENEQDAIDTAGDDEDSPFEKPVITKEKMHREIFENLPEFDGF